MNSIWLLILKPYLTRPFYAQDHRTTSKWIKVFSQKRKKICKHQVSKVKEKSSHIWNSTGNKSIVNSQVQIASSREKFPTESQRGWENNFDHVCSDIFMNLIWGGKKKPSKNGWTPTKGKKQITQKKMKHFFQKKGFHGCWCVFRFQAKSICSNLSLVRQ